MAPDGNRVLFAYKGFCSIQSALANLLFTLVRCSVVLLPFPLEYKQVNLSSGCGRPAPRPFIDSSYVWIQIARPRMCP